MSDRLFPRLDMLLCHGYNPLVKADNYIAVDLGAESGRVMLGTLDGSGLSLAEIFRFENGPLETNGSLRWDFNGLLANVKTGIGRAIKAAGGRVAGIGIDTWGVDFGLLDSGGALLENPYHYRDARTDNVMEQAFRLVPKRKLYDITGIQFLQFNTVYQLLACRMQRPELLEKADSLLFMAGLLGHALCGRAYCEYTLASTSGLLDCRKGVWAEQIFPALGLPSGIMPEIISPGTIVGSLKKNLCVELGCGPVDIIATASHDTAAAVAAVPATGENWAYLSSGTWSLMGVETALPVINDASFENSFTNEGGVGGTVRFLKNIMGLWLLQECRRKWQADGHDYSYDQLCKMAADAEPFAAFLECNRPEFLAPDNMPERINNCLEQTGQRGIADHGLMSRVILEGLAIEYRRVLESIENITGRRADVLHIVGGGARNELLCRFAASAIGRRVVTGPAEATAAGNVLTQAMATGRVKSLVEARAIVRNSFELIEYQPENTEAWAAQYEKNF